MYKLYEKAYNGGVQLYSDKSGNTFICVRSNKSAATKSTFYEVTINKFGHITLTGKKYQGRNCIVYPKSNAIPVANLETSDLYLEWEKAHSPKP